MRKHLAQVHSWPYRIATVTNLDAGDYEVLQDKGEIALGRRLARQGEFLYPAVDIRQPRAIRLDTSVVRGRKAELAIVVRPGETALCRIAMSVAAHVRRATGVSIAILSDGQTKLLDRQSVNLLILGGSHQNDLARRLAYRRLWGASETLPGPGGLMAYTLHGLFRSDRNILLLAADGTEKEALKLLLENFVRLGPEEWGFRRLMAGIPGRALRPRWSDPRRVFARLARSTVLSTALFDSPRSRAQSLDAAARVICAQYEDGGPESNRVNVFPLITASLCFQAYQVTADRQYLSLYKRTLWGLLEHTLLRPGGASYLNDLDFYLGGLIISWSMAEAEPIFNDDERLVITNFLLAASRQVARYREAFWKTAPGKDRCNHETFPALSLLAAGTYYGDCYAIPDAGAWRATARQVFSGPVGKVVKHLENAGLYQWIVPLHKFTYDTYTGGMEMVKNGILHRTARRILPCLDNFGYLAEGGDNVLPLNSGHFIAGTSAPAADLLRAGAAHGKDPELLWAWRHLQEAAPSGPFSVLPVFTLGQLSGEALPTLQRPPPRGGWDRLPFEETIRRRACPNFPKERVADKIAFRQGWQPEDQYLLFSPYSWGHHIHFDMNSILRYNDKGRIWLVDNGYGWPAGMKNIALMFAQRQRGPEDHNTLIFRDSTGQPTIPPPVCAITSLGRAGEYFALQSALCNIDGSDWLRSVLVCRGEFLLVMDQVLCGGRQTSVECQWNALGAAVLKGNRWELRQGTARMFAQFAHAGETTTGTYLSEQWRQTFESGAYPYAHAPVQKLRETVKIPRRGDRLTFVNLFTATHGRKLAHELAWDGDTVHIMGNVPRVAPCSLGSMSLAAGSSELACRLSPVWKLPAGLSRKAFSGCSPCP